MIGRLFYFFQGVEARSHIMIGVSSERFDLHNSVTLDQVANVAGRITGAVDVSDFNAGVAWGKDGGLKTGNVSATRGDVLKALYIAAGSPAVEDTGILARFKDSASIVFCQVIIPGFAKANSLVLPREFPGNCQINSLVLPRYFTRMRALRRR